MIIYLYTVKGINLGTYGILPEAPNYIPPIRYEALSICLKQVNEYAVANNATVHMPRIGAGLAGGKWNIIEDIIKNSITVDTFVYDMPVIKNKT